MIVNDSSVSVAHKLTGGRGPRGPSDFMNFSGVPGTERFEDRCFIGRKYIAQWISNLFHATVWFIEYWFIHYECRIAFFA